MKLLKLIWILCESICSGIGLYVIVEWLTQKINSDTILHNLINQAIGVL